MLQNNVTFSKNVTSAGKDVTFGIILYHWQLFFFTP
jgi:hypothetical protein